MLMFDNFICRLDKNGLSQLDTVDTYTLKGQYHEIFCFRFFSWITFPLAPENDVRVIKNFFKIRKSRYTTSINDTGGKFAASVKYTGVKFATGINDTVGKFGHRYSWCCWYQWQICRRCQRHRWQIMGTISSCWHLEVNLKAKLYLYVNSTSQRCPNKIIKIFLTKDFFHSPPVSTTPVVHLELRISPRIS